jgi:hypothetical protein
MNIKKILLISIIIYLIISHSKKNENIEKFGLSDTDKNEIITLIRPVVKEIYNTDMEAVRQLAAMATKLNAGGLEIPGNLTVTGTISSSGEITSNKNSYSLSGLNNKIDSVNSSVSTNSNNITSITNKINERVKRTTARYIKIGNNHPEFRRDNWTLIKVRAFDINGTNVALNKPVSLLEGKAHNNTLPSNVTHGNVFNGGHHDNWDLGFHGIGGTTVLQVDLGSDMDLSVIQLFNRWHGDISWRMDGTIIELIGENGQKNRIIDTGLWNMQYSKEFTL